VPAVVDACVVASADFAKCGTLIMLRVAAREMRMSEKSRVERLFNVVHYSHSSPNEHM